MRKGDIGLSERGKMQSRCLGGAAVHGHTISRGFTSMPQVRIRLTFFLLEKYIFKDFHTCKSYAYIKYICTSSLINVVASF